MYRINRPSIGASPLGGEGGVPIFVTPFRIKYEVLEKEEISEGMKYLKSKIASGMLGMQ